MGFNVTYRTLFEISILHGYFLNSGTTEYNAMNAIQKKAMLKNYAFENYIAILPTKDTAALLKNSHLVYRKNGAVIQVGIKVSPDDLNRPFTPVSLDATFTFIIRIKDFLFENYTDIGFAPNQLLYLSNMKPDTEPGTFKYVPLLADNVFANDNFKISEETTANILKTLDEHERKGLFAMVSLTMQGDKTALNCLSDGGELLPVAPHFKVHFNNRRTYWKYIKGNVAVETRFEKPLTKNGFVEVAAADFSPANPDAAKYPNPSVKSIKKAAGKIYSEVFI